MIPLFKFLAVIATFALLVDSLAIPRGRQAPRQSNKASSERNLESKPSRGSGRNKKGYALRSAGVRSSAKRPPRWEKEGDMLYQRKIHNLSDQERLNITFAEASLVLSKFCQECAANKPDLQDRPLSAPSRQPKESEDIKDGRPPNLFWGSLPVGPILRQKLQDAGFDQPTSIQTAAFQALTKKSRADGSMNGNAIIAAPTGTGKSLAYLLPLLANPKSGKRSKMMAMIVAPTVALAYQLQREVDRLWPCPDGNSLLHVVDLNSGDLKESRTYMNVREAPIIAGTPRGLRQFIREIRNHEENKKKIDSTPDELKSIILEMQQSIEDDEATSDLASNARALKDNLKVIILDEADILLKTEGEMEKAQSQRSPRNAKMRSSSPKRLSQTESLLQELPLQSMQVICASATVGRTLRRQLMNLLSAPSMEKAASLITAADDARTKKDDDRRRSSLMPSTLTHYHRLVNTDSEMSVEGVSATVLESVSQTLENTKAGPTLIFPFSLGVEQVQNYLREMGFSRVLSLSDLQNQDSRKEKNRNDFDASDKSQPIYVVGEKFGRGLDIENLQYVLLLNVPTSAAGYAHLAGRTARNGKSGSVITIVQPKSVHAYVEIARSLIFAPKSIVPTAMEQP